MDTSDYKQMPHIHIYLLNFFFSGADTVVDTVGRDVFYFSQSTTSKATNDKEKVRHIIFVISNACALLFTRIKFLRKVLLIDKAVNLQVPFVICTHEST